MSVAKLRVFRGDAQGGEEKEYEVPVDEGMVVSTRFSTYRLTTTATWR